MNNSSSAPSSVDVTDTENSTTQSASKVEGSTDIANSLMSLIAKLMDLMADGTDKGGESAPTESTEGAASNDKGVEGAEGSAATEGAMAADSTNGDQEAASSQDPVQLLQMMLELITQLIAMLQDKASGTEADSTEAMGESSLPSASEKAGEKPSSVGGDVSGKEEGGDAGSASAGEVSGNSDAMGAGDTEGAGDLGGVAETEGATGIAESTGVEGEMDAQDTLSLLQELLKLLTQMTEMMQGKPTDAASEPEVGEGVGATEPASPSDKAEATDEGGAVSEEGVGSAASDDAQSIEQLLEPLLALLAELVSMMQGKPADETASTEGAESSEGEAPIEATAGKESAMNAGEASDVEGATSAGEVSELGAEGGMVDILKLLTQIIEMLQSKSAEASSGEEVAAIEEGVMGASDASDTMGAEGADTEGGSPESLDKDQMLEKVFTLLTQLLMQMMQQMGVFNSVHF